MARVSYLHLTFSLIVRYTTLQTYAPMDRFGSARPLMSDQKAPTPHLQLLHQRNGGGQKLGVARLLYGQARDR